MAPTGPRFRLRNRTGEPVDPVPFGVALGALVLVCFSFGPVYFLTLGVSPLGSVLLTGAVWGVLAVVVFHRMVWTVVPAHHAEVPASQRLVRLVYAVVAAALLLLALSAPLILE